MFLLLASGLDFTLLQISSFVSVEKTLFTSAEEKHSPDTTLSPSCFAALERNAYLIIVQTTVVTALDTALVEQF